MGAAANEIQAIFCEALERQSLEDVAKFLDDACADNSNLRREVEGLLAAHQQARNFLGGSGNGDESTIEPLHMEAPGANIGPYKLLEQIGEGGFGVVFMAEQTHPIRRKVALKIIKPGMDTREVIARFEAERQALAMMDHPNIAKVYDAGATESGRPYFVMEVVQGVPITEYCDQCNLTTRERLELFVAVCQAVQHAHQKGIIHRDIKPTNVLVATQDGRPMPKVIDFGVAKAIEGRLTEHTLTTGCAQMVGTPLYMSPEQAALSPLGVDTRSDIYSLGILLYEILTGATPFDKDRLHDVGYDEMRRIIQEEEPPRPSARLSTLTAGLATTIAEHRRTDARRLSQIVRGDLDWIVMKCLEKERNRRYETANGLAQDVRRYLESEPITARPPSRLYRFQKMVRRNTAAFAVAAAMLICLVVGFGLSTWFFLKERDARQRMVAAERERHSLESFERGERYARTGQWARAAAEFASVLRRRPEQHDVWYKSAPLWLQSGDVESYHRHCREMLYLFAFSSDPMVAERTVKACLLAPINQRNLEPLSRLARMATTGTENSGFREYFLLASGMLEFRAGKFDESVATLEPISRPAAHRRPNILIPVNMCLAMAHFQKGRFDKARRAFSVGEHILKVNELPRLAHPDIGDGWHDLLIELILYREAAQLLNDANNAGNSPLNENPQSPTDR